MATRCLANEKCERSCIGMQLWEGGGVGEAQQAAAHAPFSEHWRCI